MPDPQTSTDAAPKAGAVIGIDKPFTGKDAAKDGVDSDTGLFEGVHPDSNERVSVTLAGLQAQFGKDKGEDVYLKIAGIAGGSVFFNPTFEATSFRPPLGISGLKKEHADLVEKILSDATKE